MITGDLKIEDLKRDREQLFAEALARINFGEQWWHVPIELARAVQADRLEVDEMMATVEEFLIGKSEITIKEIWLAKDVFCGDPSKLGRVESNRITKIMRGLGWVRKKVRRGMVTEYAWVRT